MITVDDFARREFELASSPHAWALSAFGLKHAAEVMWAACGEDGASGIGEDAALGAAYILLAGYALENVIKALLLNKKPELCKPGRVPRWPSGGHNLLKLFDEGAVDLSSDERKLLDRLRGFVVWRGRYPMPMKPETIKTERALSWVTSPVPVGVSRNDHNLAVGLFERVVSMLPY